MEILGNLYIFEIIIVNRQNAVGSVPKAKILEILRNLHNFEIEAVALQNMIPFASARPREGVLYMREICGLQAPPPQGMVWGTIAGRGGLQPTTHGGPYHAWGGLQPATPTHIY